MITASNRASFSCFEGSDASLFGSAMRAPPEAFTGISSILFPKAFLTRLPGINSLVARLILPDGLTPASTETFRKLAENRCHAMPSPFMCDRPPRGDRLDSQSGRPRPRRLQGEPCVRTTDRIRGSAAADPVAHPPN